MEAFKIKGYKWVIRDTEGKLVEWALFLTELGVPMVKTGDKPIKFDSLKEVNSYMRKNHLFQYKGYRKEIIKEQV
jgi:hypothetical protein